MAVGKTYLAGGSGLFRVYDHVTDIWTDRSGFTTADLYDVKTGETDPDYAIVCGLNYIGYTTNAGANFTQSSVPLGAITRAFQISIPGGIGTIYICGSGGSSQAGVIKSTDGGITYTPVISGLNSLYGNLAQTIYFIDSTIGLIGHGEYIAKTVNGGTSWSYLNGGSPVSPGEKVSGVHISANQQVIIAVTNKSIYKSTNAGVSFSQVYSIGTPSLYDGQPLKYSHLSWFDDDNLWVSAGNGPILYTSNAGSTWSSVLPAAGVDEDARTIFASHFYQLDKGFFGVNQYGNNIAAVYKAANANVSIVPTLSNNYIGTNENSYALWTLLKEDVYALYDCNNQEEPLYSNDPSLSIATGKVINIVGSDLCWQVSLVEFDNQTFTNVTIATNEGGYLQIFDDCQCCLPIPEPVPVKYTRVIPKPDRKFYQIKQSQCDVTGNIRFAEGYYRLFKTLKYGIANACDNINLEKLWIKKNLSDLAMINDPTACIITTPVTPVVCPEPSGNPFVPPPSSYIFTVGETEIGQGTLGCTTCLDGSLPGPGLVCPAFNISLSYNILDSVNPDDTYVFSYNGGCVITLGSFIAAGETEGFPVYAMTETNIVNAGTSPEDPCASCAG